MSSEAVLPQHLVEVTDDADGNVDEVFGQRNQPRPQVRGPAVSRWRGQAAEVEHVVALIHVKAQCPAEGDQDLLGWVRAAALLQPGVVVRGHPDQAGDFVAA